MNKLLLLSLLFISVSCATIRKGRELDKAKELEEETLNPKIKLSISDLALLKKYEDDFGLEIIRKKSASKSTIKLYKFIDEWYGVPYKYAGTTKKGVDCSGLTVNLYQTVYNKKLPRSSQQMNEKSKNIPKKSMKEGDLVFFDTSDKGKASHVGVFLGDGKFFHSSTSKGVMISDFNKDDYWRKRWLNAGKF